MRHIKFGSAELLVAIQRVRNEVFLGEDGHLWVLSSSFAHFISKYLWLEGIPNHIKFRDRKLEMIYYRIILEDPTMRFSSFSTPTANEIVVMKGENKVWVEDELGKDVTPTDEQFCEDACNRGGSELGL